MMLHTQRTFDFKPVDSNTFKNILIDWYEDHKRDLPWRHTTDPYKIWLSEIILQQTRVVQGMSYYEAFVSKYPTISDLANASEDEVLTLWKGLGYYSRARNLHYSAKYIMEHHQGVFPTEYKDVLNLKGVGKYTAAAICSFAYKLNYPVVDGNVLRVITRLYGITDAIDTPSVVKQIYALSDSLIDTDRPDQYNQAIMEFGAIQCKAKSPNCETCPFTDDCVAKSEDIIDQIPYKAKKIKRKSRFFHYLIWIDGDQTLVQRREKKDIWQGLYQYPLIETENSTELELSEICKDYRNLNTKKITLEKISDVHMQKLTHRDIHARFYHLLVSDIQLVIKDEYFLVDQKKVPNFALPKVIDTYLS